jgi:hypothetical protein
MWLIGEVLVIVLGSRSLWGVLRLVMRLHKHVWVAIGSTVVWRRLVLEVRSWIVYRTIGSGERLIRHGRRGDGKVAIGDVVGRLRERRVLGLMPIGYLMGDHRLSRQPGREE